MISARPATSTPSSAQRRAHGEQAAAQSSASGTDDRGGAEGGDDLGDIGQPAGAQVFDEFERGRVAGGRARVRR